MHHLYDSIFDAAFGLRKPWRLASVELDSKNKKLKVNFEFQSWDDQKCPFCGSHIIGMSFPVKRTWNYSNFFHFDTIMTAEFPVLRCSSIGCQGHINRDAIVNTFFLDILLMVSPFDTVLVLGTLITAHQTIP